MKEHDDDPLLDEENFAWEDDAEADEYQPPRSRKIFISLTAVVILFAFIIWSFPQLGVLFSDLSFLSQNKQLQEEAIVQQSKPAIVSVEVKGERGFTNKNGTGFNIASSGLILTNYHVVQNASSINVVFSDGQSYFTDDYWQVADADLAVIRLDLQELPYLELELQERPPDQILTIIGDPLGYKQIAVQGRLGSYYQYNNYTIFEINAPIKKGSSGSPVLNTNGQAVGIIFALRDLPADQGTEYHALAIPLLQFSDEITDLINSNSQPDK